MRNEPSIFGPPPLVQNHVHVGPNRTPNPIVLDLDSIYFLKIIHAIEFFI
jgi:hypothetical protein